MNTALHNARETNRRLHRRCQRAESLLFNQQRLLEYASRLTDESNERAAARLESRISAQRINDSKLVIVVLTAPLWIWKLVDLARWLMA